MSQQSIRAQGLARGAMALLAIGGIFVSWYLTEFHIQALAGDAIGGALCDAHAVMDCDSAVHSDYSTLLGIPISLLGVSFYVAILGLVLFDRESVRNSSAPFRPAAIASTTFLVGVGYSLFLAGVSAFVLGTLCPFCVMLYVVNVVGLVTASVWAGDRPDRLVLAQIKNPGGFFNGWTGLFAFVFGVVLFAGTSVMDAEIDNRLRGQQQHSQAEQQVERIAEERYRSDDAPAKGTEEAPVHIVKFSNFPCPYCGQLAASLNRLAQEYSEEVRVEYRHMPMEAQQHGHVAARAAYCAGEQDDFWSMHDTLFGHAPNHGEDHLRDYAGRLGLDVDRFEQCLDSDEAHRRVDVDVTAGQRLSIQGTPTFFLNGLRMEGAVSYELLEQMVLEELEQRGK